MISELAPRKQLIFSADLQPDLSQVDRIVSERVQSRSAVLNVAGSYLLGSGGKRLRAALALLSARLGTYEFERVVHAATAVELIHAASLTHDDLIDDAERRRGIQAVHQRWDHGVALMVGDYLFALAAGEMALSPDTRIITYFSQAVMQICEGELSPVMAAGPLETALEQYYFKIGCKTAALFAAACKAGIASAYGSPAQIDELGRFGYQLGLAFQVIDDLLDFTGDEQVLGKPAGHDLRQGTITLPLIYAVARGGGERLAAAIDSKDEAEITWAISEVRRLGIEPTRDAAEHLVNAALDQLAAFPPGNARRELSDIAAFILERDL
jgi:heptaprenyl diphosphate synthase/octaprenyl-diphosphate synthase